MGKAGTDYKRENKADFGKERIELLYEDEHIAIIFKPSGMLSVPYPGSKNKTAQDSLENLMRKKGTFSSGHRPFVVHRLDRDTSGVMMFALTADAQKKIMDSWQTMVTERLYHAVAENPQKKTLSSSGTIDSPLAYNSHNIGFVPKEGDLPNNSSSTKKALKSKNNFEAEKSIYERNLEFKNGKASFKTISAVTHYKILCEGKYHTLFELSLETGRKNQIRAHLASKGYPLAGDENYRARTNPFGRLALHARTLEFDHPYTGKHMKFEIPEPEDWLFTVKKNSGNIPSPWNQSISKAKTSRNHQELKLPKNIPSRKKTAGMDFIQKGKCYSKK